MSNPILPSKFAPMALLVDRRADDKIQAEAELEAHKAEFFARGGQITQLPPGHSKDTPQPYANSLGPLTEARKAMKAGKEDQRFSIRPENRTKRVNKLGYLPGTPAWKVLQMLGEERLETDIIVERLGLRRDMAMQTLNRLKNRSAIRKVDGVWVRVESKRPMEEY